ncbi:metallophosphoesterase, partial [Mariniblastus sp.]|nr:metallophosphoesterase [Mariniblastus sp.]
LLKFAKITKKDRVVWLGDYVDRGPDSSTIIEYLRGLPTENNLFLRGNHEIMMRNASRNLDSMRSWASCGGDATWDSYIRDYGGDNGIESVPEEHWQFIDNLKPYFETDGHIFAHAAIDSDLEMSDQFDETLYWANFESIGPHVSGKHVICGHSSQKDGIPKSNLNATCIDTWACGDGWLTCLDVESKRYFQAKQSGETRADWLEIR